MRVVVVGAAGMLGSATVRDWSDRGHDVVALTRAEVDVTSAADVAQVIRAAAPDLLINCTAWNRVDDAEDEPEAAWAVNAWAVRSMARAAATAGVPFVHYSTDFVFDGETSRPYREEDAPNPRSSYGMSKLVGEWMAADAPAHYVLRVESLFGGAASRSTLDRMYESLIAGRSISAFSDRVVSPSYVPDVVRATTELLARRAPYGLYHCVNSGHATWLEVAQRLREWTGTPGVEIRAVLSGDVNLKARRPQFAALSNARLVAQGIVMPEWTEALRRHLRLV